MKTAAILFLICVSFTASAYTQGTAADYERAKGLRAKYEAAAIDIAAQRRGSGIVIASGIANYHAVRTSMSEQVSAGYLRQLNDAVADLVTRPAIRAVVDTLKEQLQHTSEPFVWSTIDLKSVTTPLPGDIKSGWIDLRRGHSQETTRVRSHKDCRRAFETNFEHV